MSVPELIEYLKIEEDLANTRKCVRIPLHLLHRTVADHY